MRYLDFSKQESLIDHPNLVNFLWENVGELDENSGLMI